jgi:hypothetical protein
MEQASVVFPAADLPVVRVIAGQCFKTKAPEKSGAFFMSSMFDSLEMQVLYPA